MVWGLTGLWHGAAWNFILWGVFYGVMLVLEKLILLKYLRKMPNIIQHIYGIIIFMFGWLLFWIEDMGEMRIYLAAMFGAYGVTGSSTMWELTAWEYVPVFVVCIVASTPIVPWLRWKLAAWAEMRRPKNFMETDLPQVKHLSTEGLCEIRIDPNLAVMRGRRAVVFGLTSLADVALIVLLIISIMAVVSGSFNPFIYFRF